MGLFKNEVGRPSNEIIKKRKILRILMITVILTLVLCGGFLLLRKTFFIVGANKQATIPAGVSIKISSGTKSHPLVVANKSYSPDAWVSQQQVINNTVFINGQTKLNVELSFTKEYFERLTSRKYNVFLEGYNKNGKRTIASVAVAMQPINFTKIKDSSNRVTGYKKTLSISIDSNIVLVKAVIKNKDNLFESDYVNIKIATVPTVTLKPVTGKANSKGVVSVAKPGIEYRTIVTINNPSKVEVWYRWVKYKNHNMTDPESFECKKVTSTKVVTRGLYVKENVPQRTGYVRVYTSENACKNDSKLSKTNATSGSVRTLNYISEATIKYELAKTYNAGSNWMRLRFNYDDLKSKIGKQAPGVCFNYALSYGTYVKNGNGTYTRPLTNYEGNYGAKSSYASSYYKMYTAIKAKINAGIPVSIHVGNSASSHHWVLVTGYKNGVLSSKIKNGSDLRKYLYVLDPYDLSHGQMSLDSQAAWFYGDMRYITWE